MPDHKSERLKLKNCVLCSMLKPLANRSKLMDLHAINNNNNNLRKENSIIIIHFAFRNKRAYTQNVSISAERRKGKWERTAEC